MRDSLCWFACECLCPCDGPRHGTWSVSIIVETLQVVCMCACLCVCVCVCLSVCVCVCDDPGHGAWFLTVIKRPCRCVYVCVCVCVCVCFCVCVSVCVFVCVVCVGAFARVCVYVCVCMCVYSFFLLPLLPLLCQYSTNNICLRLLHMHIFPKTNSELKI